MTHKSTCSPSATFAPPAGADFDAWFADQVQAGIREADDPKTLWVSHVTVACERRAWRDRLTRCLEDSAQA